MIDRHDYSLDRPHPLFDLEFWKAEVAHGFTTHGYVEWVAYRISIEDAE